MDDEVLEVGLMFAGLALFNVVWYVAELLLERKRRRRERLEQLARRLGLTFLTGKTTELPEALKAAPFFNEGQVEAVTNVMVDDPQRPGLVLMEFHRRFLTGGRRSDFDTTGLHVVAMVRREILPPSGHMAVYQSDLLGPPLVGEPLVRVQFENDPQFGRRFWVSERSLPLGKALLTPGVRAALRGWQQSGPRPAVQLVPGWVVAHVEAHPSERRPDKRAEALLRYARAVASALPTGWGPQTQ